MLQMKEDIDFITRQLDLHLAHVHPVLFHSVAEGVPAEMRDGAIDEDGWVCWKCIPSTITEEEIKELENEFSISFPPMMRALFRTYHYVDLHFNNIEDETGHRGDCQFIELPPMSSRDRLTRYRDIIQAWEPLLAAGYLPFTEAEDSQGPVCFDMTRIDDSGDYPVVWFLHDHLHELGEEQSRIREQVQPWERELFSSFREMIETLCGLQPVRE
ncbi:SMI1/KNR4 family protein [Paenibacillus thiaminolyticus]|uniref:SMI1/KNR4 family protein n=1 Tax=Paenibacillus thiaminolyticus TaxID=49283 RepID=UPI00234FBF0C|nr:SMI1/KNR4 family protein [Paenibacillus thiaminolyticus]WCR26930.1 SMI1/KNR4 family protein [Paenibacillus thiaminolyticus]